VDGDEVLHLQQVAQVVRVREVVELEGRVAIDEVELVIRHLGEGGADDLSRVKRLVLSGDDALPDEIRDAAGTELGMDAEVVLVTEKGEESCGNVSNPDLQRSAVADDLGRDQRANHLGRDLSLLGTRGDGWWRRLGIDFGEPSKARDVHPILTTGA